MFNHNHNPFCGPWSRTVGVARSILAAATLITLLFNDPRFIFAPLGLRASDVLSGSLSRMSLFALFDLQPARWIGVAVLLLVISGWRPRVTGLLHWYVAVSFNAAAVVIDGGDQVCTVLSLLLVPVTLCDPRKWHWQPAPCRNEETLGAFFSRSALVVIRGQVALIYLVAAIGKFKVTEWVNGTAVYYWFTHPIFGVADFRERLLQPIITNPWGVVALTWGTLALEISLAMALVGPQTMRRRLFVVGVVFHAGIIAVHGLASFGLAMIAALVLYLRTPISCKHEGAVEEAPAEEPASMTQEKMVA